MRTAGESVTNAEVKASFQGFVESFASFVEALDSATLPSEAPTDYTDEAAVAEYQQELNDFSARIEQPTTDMQTALTELGKLCPQLKVDEDELSTLAPSTSTN